MNILQNVLAANLDFAGITMQPQNIFLNFKAKSTAGRGLVCDKSGASCVTSLVCSLVFGSGTLCPLMLIDRWQYCHLKTKAAVTEEWNSLSQLIRQPPHPSQFLSDPGPSKAPSGKDPPTGI